MTTQDQAPNSGRHPYLPTGAAHGGAFVAIEGISGSGKSTLVRLLAERLSAATLHVIPPPINQLSGYVNTHARPLTQFAFYLTGVLHASDTIRSQLEHGHVVTDRYVNSVIANHTAVNGLDHHDVLTALEPWRNYLIQPDLTVYLCTSETELRKRMAGKPDLSDSDRKLLNEPGLLNRVQELYAELAAADPTSYELDTDGRTPPDLAEQVVKLAEAAGVHL